ncbi:MAG: hypothetical protein AAF645_09345 [Myxococcota bacterium]
MTFRSRSAEPSPLEEPIAPRRQATYLYTCLVVAFVAGFYAAPARAQSPADAPPNSWLEVEDSALEAVAASPDEFPFLRRSRTIRGITAFSGAAFDTNRGRLLVWGGGHNDYDGNELYAFDVNTLHWTRLSDPSEPNLCASVNADGTPNARHTYNGIQYLAHVDRFFGMGGALACQAGGCGSDEPFAFSFADARWTQLPIGDPHPRTGCENVSAYDSTRGLLWWFNATGNSTWSFDIEAERWNSFDVPAARRATAAYDSRRERIWIAGAGELVAYDVATDPPVRTVLDTDGAPAFLANQKPGWDYDPTSDRLVGWAGDEVYALNPETMEWEVFDAPGAPSLGDNDAVYGRWRYAPSVNAFVLMVRSTDNVFFYKFSPGLGTPPPGVDAGPGPDAGVDAGPPADGGVGEDVGMNDDAGVIEDAGANAGTADAATNADSDAGTGDDGGSGGVPSTA